MRSPIQPAPIRAQSWLARARYLRWLDAALAWMGVVLVFDVTVGGRPIGPTLLIAGGIVAILSALMPVRVRWRPASGLVGFMVSRALRPGDRAWYVRAARADLVIVTARRGLRVSIAAPELGAAESLSVRRTRVLLVPATAA